MKRKKNITKVLLFGIMILAAGIQGNRGIQAVAAAKLDYKKVILIKGQEKLLKIEGTKRKAIWRSTRKKVASVSKKGRITAKRRGQATIIGRIDKKKYRCQVTVEEPKLNKSKLTLKKKQTSQLKLSGTSRKVVWKSSKKNVVSVNSRGLAKAKAKGTAVITAAVGGKKYSCKVTVKKPQVSVQQGIKPTGIMLDKNELSIINGQSSQLIATVRPSNTTDRRLAWSSSNNSVVSVDANGRIVANKAGTAVIYVSCQGVSASCTVNVTPEEPKIFIRLYSSFGTPTDYLELIVSNYGKKPLTIKNLIMLKTGEETTDLYLFDQGKLVPEYTMGSELNILIRREDQESFNISTESHFSFRITYDGVQYIGVADYYGEEIILRKADDILA